MSGRNTTLLGYQTAYEFKAFDLATNFQTVGNYRMACFWAIQHAKLLGVDKMPQRPPIPPNAREASRIWEDYFESIIGQGMEEVKEKIDAIRSIYQKKGGIPQIDTSKIKRDESK